MNDWLDSIPDNRQALVEIECSLCHQPEAIESDEADRTPIGEYVCPDCR